MEAAKLFDQEINIYQEWFEQISTGSPKENIIRNLEEKYRIHSQKLAIECSCCNQPVIMVLREDSPHFRHQGDPCPSAENYKRYMTRLKGGEDSLTHRAGRAILRYYLESQLKHHSIIVQDGYLCRFTLKIVPDFILIHPDGTIWSIDYITGTREDETYNNYIQKRKEIYLNAGFKPFFFLDSSWLADVPDRSIVSFYKAERQMNTQTEIDLQWSTFVSEFFEAFGKTFVLREWFGVHQSYFNRDLLQTHEVFSLTYLDVAASKAYIQRFLPAQQNKFGYIVFRASISLERATSLDHSQQGFTWWEEEETNAMEQRLQVLSSQYERELIMEVEREQQEKQKLQMIEELEHQERLEIELANKREIEVSKPLIPVEDYDFMPVLFNEDVINLIRMDMSVSHAWQLVSTLKEYKSQLSRNSLERIRSQARYVMGPIKKPNLISQDLRSAMIEIAML
jgi:hypothetical protein